MNRIIGSNNDKKYQQTGLSFAGVGNRAANTRAKRILLFVCLAALVPASHAYAKTKMLVEDPNNIVVGRFELSELQREEVQAQIAAGLAALQVKNQPTAHAIRYLAFAGPPLNENQLRRAPERERKGEQRFRDFKEPLTEGGPRSSMVVYDLARHRIMHNRLYTVTELPPVHSFFRIDDYVAFYVPAGPSAGKQAL